MILALAATVAILWTGDPPPCPRLGEFTVQAASAEAVEAKARKVAASRKGLAGTDTIYVIKAEWVGGYLKARVGAMKCEAVTAPTEAQKEEGQ